MMNVVKAQPRASAAMNPATVGSHLGATSLMNDDVYDAAGTFLGQIEDVILDLRSGCVRYVVLGLGGFLGLGRKQFAVPWHIVTPDAALERSVVDVSLMQLMAIPVPQNDPWLQRADAGLSQRSAMTINATP